MNLVEKKVDYTWKFDLIQYCSTCASICALVKSYNLAMLKSKSAEVIELLPAINQR